MLIGAGEAASNVGPAYFIAISASEDVEGVTVELSDAFPLLCGVFTIGTGTVETGSVVFVVPVFANDKRGEQLIERRLLGGGVVSRGDVESAEDTDVHVFELVNLRVLRAQMAAGVSNIVFCGGADEVARGGVTGSVAVLVVVQFDVGVGGGTNDTGAAWTC